METGIFLKSQDSNSYFKQSRKSVSIYWKTLLFFILILCVIFLVVTQIEMIKPSKISQLDKDRENRDIKYLNSFSSFENPKFNKNGKIFSNKLQKYYRKFDNISNEFKLIQTYKKSEKNHNSKKLNLIRKRRTVRTELEELQNDLRNCKKSISENCNISHTKIIKLIKNIRAKLSIISRLLQSAEKYSKTLSISTGKNSTKDNNNIFCNATCEKVEKGNQLNSQIIISQPSSPSFTDVNPNPKPFLSVTGEGKEASAFLFYNSKLGIPVYPVYPSFVLAMPPINWVSIHPIWYLCNTNTAFHFNNGFENPRYTSTNLGSLQEDVNSELFNEKSGIIMNHTVQYPKNTMSVLQPSFGTHSHDFEFELNTKNVPNYSNQASSDNSHAAYINKVATAFDDTTVKQSHCPDNFIQCATSTDQCVPVSKWCNSEVDCPDASDETACSCKARLSESRICDGYMDCPLGEDEWGCYGCHESKFSCYNNLQEYTKANNLSMCYSRVEKCDGYKSCLNGYDERECTVITRKLENHQLHIVSYTEGYLYRNYKGKWYPVCGKSSKWATEACEAELYNYDNNTLITFKQVIIPGPFISLDLKFNQPILSQKCVIRSTNSQENVVTYVKCPEVKCGLRKIDVSEKSALSEQSSFKRSENRVAGGIISQPMEWPFVVALYRDGKFHCGGVIYNKLWILTAAHCVVDYTKHYFEIKAGILRRSSFSPMIQNVVVNGVIPHESYVHQNMKNDIALIHLKTPLLYNRWVRPICMPKIGRTSLESDWIWGPKQDTLCTTVGWGAIRERGPGSDNLLQVDVPVLEKCKRTDDKYAEDVCAGEPNGGKDACQGDSGGPLFCKSVSDDQEWYLAGIVSHGEGCARPGEPGVYTRVALYIDWIKAVVNMKSTFLVHPILKCNGFSCIWGGIKCIENKKRCDKIVDCLGGEDEVGCTFNDVSSSRNFQNESVYKKEILMSSINLTVTESSVLIQTTTGINKKLDSLKASRQRFLCKRISQKIDETRRCDRIIDCEDGSDEENCEYNNYLENRSVMPMNDNKMNCSNSTHQYSCECKKDHFKCNNGKCIPKIKFCDHINDCGDFFDEPSICSCFTYLKTTDPSRICDGILNCWDKSDEDPSICNCTSDKFQCGSSDLCIPRDFVCDNTPDCPKGEDERFCLSIDYSSYVSSLEYKYRQVIEQSYGIWHTKCYLQDDLSKKDIATTICWKLGYKVSSTPKYRFIKENNEKELPNDESNSNTIQSTKAIITDKFSPIKLNKNFAFLIRPSRPIVQKVFWNETEILNCFKLEIICDESV